jgi:hypothetical protein
VSVRRSNFNGIPFSIDSVGQGTLWFAPNVGLVKIAMGGVATIIAPAN